MTTQVLTEFENLLAAHRVASRFVSAGAWQVVTVFKDLGGYQWAQSYSYEGPKSSNPPPPSEADDAEWVQRTRQGLVLLRRALHDAVIGDTVASYLKGYDHLSTMGMDSVDGVAVKSHNVTPAALLEHGWVMKSGSLGRALYEHPDSRWKAVFSGNEKFVGFMP